MRNRPLPSLLNPPFLRYAPLSAAMACALLGACIDEADPTPAPAATARQDALATVQRDVDVVLAAFAAFDDALGDAAPALGPAYLRLARTTEAVALAAEDLRGATTAAGNAATGDALLDALTGSTAGNAASDAAIRLVSQKAGQLAPQLRKLKRALAKAQLDAATRSDLLVRVARLQIAARAFDVHAGELHRELDRDRADAATASAARGTTDRNGPLFRGSSLYVLDRGHIDAVDAAFEDDALGITVHDESAVPDVERDPANVLFVVKPAAKLQIPDTRFAFLGPVGATVWLLPQDQLDAEALGVLFLGLSTEEIEPGVFVDDSIEVRFRSILGPNGLSLFESPEDETAAPRVLVDSEDPRPDIVTLPASTHKHVNWAFESAGLYAIRVDVTGRLAGVPGQPRITSSKALLKFAVLP